VTRHRFVEPPQTWTACVLIHAKDPDRPRTATRGFLCEGHYLILEQRLAELPALADEVEQALVRGGGAGPKISGDPERALPFDEAASDALRGARDLLASWCRLILDEHPGGLHAPALALPALATFLTRHLEWIAAQPWVDDLHGEFGDVRAALLSAQSTSRTRIVALGTCGEAPYCDLETHAERCCQGTLRAFVSTVDEGADPRPIVCSECGIEHQPETWRPLARRLRKDAAWMTAAQLSELLRVPVGTVWYWAHEDDWRRLDRRPKRYHHDDAQASYEARRLEERSA
jgi:hypothetical protein